VATVLRIKKGREIVLFNGQTHNGQRGEFKGIISDINRKKVSVVCREFIAKNTLSPLNIALGACLIKNDRMDWTDLVSIHPPQKINDYMAASQRDCKIILHPGEGEQANTLTEVKKVDLLVGPEGGFSDDEVERAKEAGFKAKVLGSRILRAETAPLAYISVLQYQFGDW